jgi:hypothetical protein
MTDNEKVGTPAASVEEILQGWHELKSKVGQLEAEKEALLHDHKELRRLLERVVDHRQKSHSELVLLITGLVSKLQLNDVGVIVSRLVEHNANVSQSLAAFLKGAADAELPQPMILQQLDQTKRNLTAAVKPVVEELIQLDSPFELEMLQSLIAEPELFFSPRMTRANRSFVKGHVPRERIVREFGEGALVYFNDMTTDAKLNPHPKAEEIVVGFKSDFETLLQQGSVLSSEKSQELMALYKRVQGSKSTTDQSRAQKQAFQRLSFIAELLHFYDNPTTETPDAIFAQRLPGLVEQLVLSGPQDKLDEKLIVLAESLIAFIARPDHRQMVINNVGKSGGAAKTLRFVLKLRSEKLPEGDPEMVIPEFAKHLIPPPPDRAPLPESLAAILRLVDPEVQRLTLKAILRSDKIRKDEATTLIRAAGAELGLKEIPEAAKGQEGVSLEIERQIAWANIAALIARRNEASVVAAAIRDRLNARYDAEEIRQSWVTLIEADAISLIRIFCQVPYLANGKTDPIARTVMETYVTRLTHEKYAATYTKVVNSLRNMFAVKPDSPVLLNFMGLVKWVSPEAATKLAMDVGMPVAA